MLHSSQRIFLGKRGRGWSSLVGCIVFLVAGCGEGDGPRDIQETRRVRSTGDPARVPTSAERFGFEAQAPAGHARTGSGFAWQLPSGWRELAPTPMRTANFEVAADVECYLTVLPGGGGGLAANLNRWRRQMSLPPHSDAEIAALPRRKVLNEEARYVEYEGTYVGMDGNVQRPRSLMIGIALEHAGQGIFLKMVGPAEVVRGQIAAFDALCASLRETGGHEHATSPGGGTAVPSPAATGEDVAFHSDGSADLQWTAPPDWTRAAASPMRLVSFSIGTGTECYVTVLEGAAGGLEANVNRWRQQMAQPPLDAVALAALPQVPMLGTTGRLVQIRGDFTGMDGATRHGFALIGAVCEMGERTVFVKMTGPETEVRTELTRFEAFCRSLH